MSKTPTSVVLLGTRAASRVASAVLVSALLVAGAGPAAADWQVRRQGAEAGREQALRALGESPEDGALAARLVQRAKRAELAAILERLRAGANHPRADYGAVMGYAQLLLAAGHPA